jgi:hypothetical protein
MNRSTAWCVPLATLALSTAAQGAEPGFYFAASASRVEHDVEGRPGVPVLIAAISPSPSPNPFPRPGPPIIGTPGCCNPFPPLPGFIAPDSIEIDDVDTGFSATVGYRINRYLAAELTYTDFGEYEVIERYSFTNFRYELGTHGPSISVLGSLPLGEQWELFLRGGVLFADQEVTQNVIVNLSEQDLSDEVVIAGAGVQWSFAPRWAARIEYQRTDELKYDNASESSIDQASLSVLFKL